MKKLSVPIACFMLFGLLAFGQRPSPSNSPNRNLFSSDLVMWSYMQEPQPAPSQTRQTPTPEPSPDTQPQPQQQNPNTPEPQQNPPAPPSKDSPTSAKSETATAQSFTGTISKEASSFVLQVSTTVFYKLDNAQQVQQYEGQRVRVTGTLDSSINLIHVDKVEPLT
jgi:outer membrane biosynthesis protein TonB